MKDVMANKTQNEQQGNVNVRTKRKPICIKKERKKKTTKRGVLFPRT